MLCKRYLNLSISLGIMMLMVTSCFGEGNRVEKQSGALSEALWELAKGAEDASSYEKAASYYDRLHERHPKNKIALLGYARNLRYLGLPKDAIKALQAWKKEDNDLDLKTELGKAQLAAAQINDARITFTEVIEKDPNRWEAHSALGIIFDRLKNYTDAHSSYQKALELSPDNTSVQNNFALSLSQDGQIDRAIMMLKQIVEDNESGPQIRQNLSLLYGLKGEFKKSYDLSLIDLPRDLATRNLVTLKGLRSIRTENTNEKIKPD